MNKKGFTLVELIAVIALIAILSTAAILGVTGIINRQKNKSATVSEKNINEASLTTQTEKQKLYLPSCIDKDSGNYTNVTETTLKKINDDLRAQMASAGKVTEAQKQQYVKDFVKNIENNSDAKKNFSDSYLGVKNINCFKLTSVADIIDDGYLKDLDNGCDRSTLVVVYKKGDSANKAGALKAVQETGICKGSATEEKGPLITVDPEIDMSSTATKTIKVTATANESKLKSNLTLTYGWSKSVRKKPTSWETKALTGNQNKVSTTLTKSGMDDEFYLWIKAGSVKDDKGYSNTTFATGPYSFLPTPLVTYSSQYEDPSFPLRGGKRCGGETTCHGKTKRVVFRKPYGMNVEGNPASLCTPSCTGYTFKGWNLEELIIDNNSRVDKRTDHTIKADYEPLKPKVTFNANGGTTPVPPNKQVTYDSPYEELATTSRVGYSGVGDWFTAASGGTEIHPSTYVSNYNDHTLYKHWNANKFNVAYNGNGATSGSVANHQCTYDQPCSLSANGFTRGGYTFNGWKLNNTGATLAAGASIKNATSVNNGTVTYYAQWCQNCNAVANGQCTLNASTAGVCSYTTTCNSGYHITAGNATYNPTCGPNSFTVAYNGHGSTSGSVSSHTCNYDDACTLKNNGFKKSGYKFAGWKKANAGSLLSPGASIKNAVASGTVTYYAQWDPCPAGTFETGGACSACPAGQYQNATGKTTCKACPSGQYQNQTGKTGCKACPSGQYQNASGQVSCKTCPSCFSSSAGASSCRDVSAPTANPWTSTTVSNTSVTEGRAVFTLSNLGSDCGTGISQIRYWTSCDGTRRTANVSGNAATLNVPPCATYDAVLYYELIDGGNNSSNTISTSRIGTQLIFAEAYNWMRDQNPIASSTLNGRAQSIDYHNVLEELYEGLIGSRTFEYNNKNFVKRLYKTVLGRDGELSPPHGGMCNWRINLAHCYEHYEDSDGCSYFGRGYTQRTVLPVFCRELETQNIYKAWGIYRQCPDHYHYDSYYHCY